MDKKVVELFAGVGGFRVGLNKIESFNSDGRAKENKLFDFVWANQWEPATSTQHAFDCYIKRFGHSEFHINEDIASINKSSIPDHTLLVGGFPCQDYSVARSLSQEKGIEGKKGVLWWQIHQTLVAKKPPFLLLENVDRLLKSPSKQRGRDFGIMLRSLNDLGYGVEWRVINAADYGRSQRRRRVFIFGFHETTNYYSSIENNKLIDIISEKGFFASTFAISSINEKRMHETDITNKTYSDLVSVSEKFAFGFWNSGIALNGKVKSVEIDPLRIPSKTLGETIIPGIDDEKFNLTNEVEKYKYLKGAKKIERTSQIGVTYNYSEGSMSFPDNLSQPARTMLTSEGSINRSTHVIVDPKTNKYRLLTPVETERLNDFPDDWTNTGMPIRRRYFMMGNALVCGIVSKMGETLSTIIDKED